MVAGHFLGLVKESVIANYFGVSAQVDAYTIAITIPVTIFALISVSIQSIVIPIYTDLLYNKGKEISSKYVDNLISIISVFTLLIIAVCELFASPLVHLFAPGFDNNTHDMGVSMLRICMPTILFSIIDKVLIGLLNVHKQFVRPSLSVYFLNICLIITIIFLHSTLGITAACIGQVFGSIIQVLFLLIVAKKYYRYHYSFELFDLEIKKSIKQALPVMWSISIAELCAVINRVVASFLFVGSISALGYASKINSVFISFFTAAISTIVYPFYAESIAKKDMSQFNNRINLTLSVYAFFLLPLIVYVFCFRHEIIQLAFGRGAFGRDAVGITGSLLGCYAAGLLFMALRENLTKVFYSVQDTKTPAKNATIGVCLNIFLNVSLPFLLGIQGLAIATSVTALIISLLLIKDLTNKHQDINISYFLNNLYRLFIISVILYFLIKILLFFINFESSFVRLLFGGLLLTLFYIVLSFLFRIDVIERIKEMLKSSKNQI